MLCKCQEKDTLAPELIVILLFQKRPNVDAKFLNEYELVSYYFLFLMYSNDLLQSFASCRYMPQQLIPDLSLDFLYLNHGEAQYL